MLCSTLVVATELVGGIIGSPLEPDKTIERTTRTNTRRRRRQIAGQR